MMKSVCGPPGAVGVPPKTFTRSFLFFVPHLVAHAAHLLSRASILTLDPASWSLPRAVVADNYDQPDFDKLLKAIQDESGTVFLNGWIDHRLPVQLKRAGARASRL